MRILIKPSNSGSITNGAHIGNVAAAVPIAAPPIAPEIKVATRLSPASASGAWIGIESNKLLNPYPEMFDMSTSSWQIIYDKFIRTAATISFGKILLIPRLSIPIPVT